MELHDSAAGKILQKNSSFSRPFHLLESISHAGLRARVSSLAGDRDSYFLSMSSGYI